MKLFILITGIGEVLIGLLMFFKPTVIPLLLKEKGIAFSMARMYGAAATTIGAFAVMVSMYFDRVELHQPFLMVYLVFHTLVAASVLVSIRANEPADSKIAVLHSLLAIGTAYFLWNSFV